MTLLPIFRSAESLGFLKKSGYLNKFAPAIKLQRDVYKQVSEWLTELGVHEATWVTDPGSQTDEQLLQKDFFLILFNSVLMAHTSIKKVSYYARVNLATRGMINAADQILDDEEKPLLKLDIPPSNSKKLLEYNIFSHLFLKAHQTAVDEGIITKGQHDEIIRLFYAIVADIGKLEGSEEIGIKEYYSIDETIEQVIRIRGGNLFLLGTCSPKVCEPKNKTWAKIYGGIENLGVGFQIVDDLTDFEFDIKRGSHNILETVIQQEGTYEEKRLLMPIRKKIRRWNQRLSSSMLMAYFPKSTKRVLGLARDEVRVGFKKLQEAGFWFDPKYSINFVRSIWED